MLRLLLAVLSAFAWQSALAQSHGRVLAYPNPLDDPDAPEVIDLKIVQAVAFPNSSGHLELYLLPVTVPVDDLGQALLPIQYYRRRIDALDLVWVSATVRPADGTASASLHRGPHYGPDLGPGVLVGGRVEDGRLRGRMLVISAFKGRFLVDVSVDAPIISPAAAQALPADGGEPWQALLRLRSALAAGDEAGVLGALVPSLAQDIAGDFQADMPTLRAQFPMDPPLEQGWLTDVDARLVLLDESGAEPVRVMVDMARYQAGWRLQVISYRPHGRAIQPTELESFPPPERRRREPAGNGDRDQHGATSRRTEHSPAPRDCIAGPGPGKRAFDFAQRSPVAD